MKTMIAMMLAAAFLISRPALAGDEAPKAEKTEKAPKSKKDKKEKKEDKGAAKDEAKGEKKAEKGGW